MEQKLGEKPMEDRIFVLVDYETKAKLSECTKILNTTRSDVVRKGIDKVYDDLKK